MFHGALNFGPRAHLVNPLSKVGLSFNNNKAGTPSVGKNSGGKNGGSNSNASPRPPDGGSNSKSNGSNRKASNNSKGSGPSNGSKGNNGSGSAAPSAKRLRGNAGMRFRNRACAISRGNGLMSGSGGIFGRTGRMGT